MTIREQIESAMPRINVELVYKDEEEDVEVQALIFPRVEDSSVHIVKHGSSRIIFRLNGRCTYRDDSSLPFHCADDDDVWELAAHTFSEEQRDAARMTVIALRELAKEYA